MAVELAGGGALVTGASSGIGRAVARALAARGAKVVCADVDDAGGRAVAEETGGLFVHTDVRDPAASVAAVRAGEDAFGRLVFAHLNAGIAVGRTIDELDLDTYRRILGINVDGVVFGVQAALPALRRAGGGALVATASLAGLVPTPGDPAYSLTKHAVVGLVRALAPPLEEEGITVNALCPGFADTPILGESAKLFRDADFPLLTPEDVAAAVLAIVDSGQTGQAWPVQPGRDTEPYRFRGVPGPRVSGHEGQAPPWGAS